MKRRDFLKKGALAAAGAGLLGSGTTLAKGLELTDEHKSVNFNVNGKARMHLSFEPYELKLKHVFTVSSENCQHAFPSRDSICRRHALQTCFLRALTLRAANAILGNEILLFF